MVVGSVELLKIYVKTQLQWAYTLWKLCRAVTNMGFEAIYAIVFVYCESPRAAAQGEARRRAVVTRKKSYSLINPGGTVLHHACGSVQNSEGSDPDIHCRWGLVS